MQNEYLRSSEDEHETRDDKFRLRGGYIIVADMESAARVCLRDDAGDCKHFVGSGRFGLRHSDSFCNQQRDRKDHARFSGLYCGADSAWNLL